MKPPPKLKNIYSKIIKFIQKHVFIYGYKPTQLKRMFKATLLTSLCFTLSCINPVDAKLGTSSYLCSLISVSMHPGRRLGAMMQSLVLGLGGVLLGIPYTLFGHYLARKIFHDTHDIQKSFGLFIVLDAFVLIFVGYIRSAAPRVYPFAFVVFLISHFSFLMPISTTLEQIAHNFSVPIIIGIGLSFIINITIFPEFGSTYIGSTALDVIHELQVMFSNTSYLFVSLHDADPASAKEYADKIAFLIAQKKKVRTAFAQSAATMLECTYELSYSYMAPQELKPLLKNLHSLNNTTNALHVACELVLSVFVAKKQADTKQEIPEMKSAKELLKRIKPQKEVDYSDREMIIEFIHSIKNPVQDVTKVALHALNQSKSVLAYAYDVNVQNVKFSNVDDISFEEINEETRKVKYPVTVEQIDECLRELAQANQNFSEIIKQELAKVSDQEVDYIYLVPREEYFIMSMFILNFRENSILISKILSQMRRLLETRQRREARGWFKGKHIWFSSLNSKKAWYKFLKSGSDEPQEGETASINATKQSGQDFEKEREENLARNQKKKPKQEHEHKPLFWIYHILHKTKSSIKAFLSKVLRFMSKRKLHLENAFRTVFLLLLLSFPGFSHNMSAWYANYRGAWVGFAALSSLETNVGATSFGAITRIICVTLGSTWGLCIYLAGDYGDDRYLMVALMFLGALPFYYFTFYSPFGKAGVLGIVSMAIVPLSTLRSHGVSGSIFENYGKRCLSMIIGGTAATLVNITVFPQKARVLLVDQIIYALKYSQLINLQLAVGLNGEAPHKSVHSEQMFSKYQKKARASLQTAETLLGVSKREPRLKGSFKIRSEIYSEIIFVLNQILDRCNNIRFLRQQYGSAVLDELCPYTYVYRRETYASMASLLRVAEEALFSKSPVPQFLPSPRIAHLRVVNVVRQLLFQQLVDKPETENSMLRDQYMGWSASSGATEEVIEYMEELVDLIKFLVGCHSFSHGFLSRPLVPDWQQRANGTDDSMSFTGSEFSSTSLKSCDSVPSYISLEQRVEPGLGFIPLLTLQNGQEGDSYFTHSPTSYNEMKVRNNGTNTSGSGDDGRGDSYLATSLQPFTGFTGIDGVDGGMLERKGTIDFPKQFAANMGSSFAPPPLLIPYSDERKNNDGNNSHNTSTTSESQKAGAEERGENENENEKEEGKPWLSLFGFHRNRSSSEVGNEHGDHHRRNDGEKSFGHEVKHSNNDINSNTNEDTRRGEVEDDDGYKSDEKPGGVLSGHQSHNHNQHHHSSVFDFAEKGLDNLNKLWGSRHHRHKTEGDHWSDRNKNNGVKDSNGKDLHNKVSMRERGEKEGQGSPEFFVHGANNPNEMSKSGWKGGRRMMRSGSGSHNSSNNSTGNSGMSGINRITSGNSGNGNNEVDADDLLNALPMPLQRVTTRRSQRSQTLSI